VGAASLALGLALGWAIPGLSLAMLAGRTATGAQLLARALGLGSGYILATGLAHAAIAGHAPRRPALLALLALPSLALALRSGAQEAGSRSRPWTTVPLVLAASALLTAALWPKLAREALNGDGTEAYELARSLEDHALPRWDLERGGGEGRFGTPAVNPFLTNSYHVAAAMQVAGRGELAARLGFAPALALAALLAFGIARRRGLSGAAYVVSVAAVSALWNAYAVGYEPPFTDLAEPAATDTLMTALWLAGFLELTGGSARLGVGFLVLASGVLYSAPVLASVALAALAWQGAPGARRATLVWALAFGACCAAALLGAAAAGVLPDWIRQWRGEYWHDFVDQGRRTPALPLLAQLALATGALPLAALARWRTLPDPARALVATSAVYLALVVASSHKNLHYLAPLPFLLAPAALDASGPRLRAAAVAVVAAAFALSLPSPRGVRRENVELARASCVDGLGYEDAALAGDVVYTAFERPGGAGRFAVGKHTFVRYALELGAPLGACTFRLAPREAEGFVTVARREAALGVRDLDAYVAWRFRQLPVPSAELFPAPPRPPALPVGVTSWRGRYALDGEPGSALVVADFDDEGPGRPARLLVPVARPGSPPRLTVASEAPVALALRVNGGPAAALRIDAGPEVEVLADTPAPWRVGWNVVELQAADGAVAPRLRSVELGSTTP
jgi:hypothetical protein